MKKKIKYSDEPMENVRVILDFLPSPEQLAFKQETVKVTITLTKKSVEYFKEIAHKYNTQYQKMIRSLLDDYVRRHQKVS
jgi:predicted DNA binding CopG/RHH family protein